MNKFKSMAAFLLVPAIILAFTGCGMKKSGTIKNQYSIKAKELDSNVDNISNANNKGAFKFLNYELQTHKNTNIVISPLSLNTVLAMTQNGAANKTKEEILSALELNGINDSTINDNYRKVIAHFNSLDAVNINMANSIWIQKGINVRDDFTIIGRENYEAEIYNVDFNKSAAVNAINKWVSDKTFGRIKKLNTNLDNVTMVLINTIYFKGKWAEPFKEKDTTKEVFNLSDGSKVNVDMMKGVLSVDYLKAKDFSAARLSYDDNRFGFYIFLPNKGNSTDKLMQSMTYDNWNNWENDFKHTKVNINLPKFKIEYEDELNQMLQGFGMKDAFSSESADFSKITDKEKLYVRYVKQKCYMDVNEAGTEAAAATEVAMDQLGIEVDKPIDFTVDRPFIYAVADKKTGLIIFMGKVEKP
ncbi:serpin family protein [Candidatus Clostridium radicumherbarum]|uniref:Serpin family protein n=1 Tax=Candidatus Clostridium radicumherbarum TaxID=3381662 RepID=A0ABW8TXL3_9CLOT